MANSTIIPVEYLQQELPNDANDTNNRIEDSVNQASSFINTFAERYYPFDEYNLSTCEPRAPYEIVRICIEVAKAMYYMRVSQTNRDGNEKEYWRNELDYYKQQLIDIKIEPTWEEQIISLSSNNEMIIGSRNAGGIWPMIIPQNATVISNTTNTWINGEDWEIRKGGKHSDEYPDAWYFYADSSSVEGKLRYMRTYRNDYSDYGRYSKE